MERRIPASYLCFSLFLLIILLSCSISTQILGTQISLGELQDGEDLVKSSLLEAYGAFLSQRTISVASRESFPLAPETIPHEILFVKVFFRPPIPYAA